MKNVFKSNGPTLFKQWNSTDTEIVDDNDSDFLLAREFVAGEGVAARSMDNELSITHHDFKNRSQSGINSEFDDFGFNNYAPDPMADASLEDDFGITAALHFKISEHFQMLQQETSSEKALQPLLEEIAQVLSFDILSDNLTALLKALLEEVSKAMDFCLSRAQTLTILESFQKQLQKLPIEQVCDVSRTSVAEAEIAIHNDAIAVIEDALEAFSTDITWNRGSVLNVEERNPKYNEFCAQGEAKVLSYIPQEMQVYTVTVGAR